MHEQCDAPPAQADALHHSADAVRKRSGASRSIDGETTAAAEVAALLARGYEALMAADLERARADFERAQQVLPERPLAAVLLATLDLLTGKAAVAHTRLVGLRAEHPGCPLVRAHLVEALLALGRHAQARAELHRLRRLDMPPELVNFSDALEEAIVAATPAPSRSTS